MDFLFGNRTRNLFDNMFGQQLQGQPEFTPNTDNGPTAASDVGNINARLESMLNPSNQAQDQLLAMLANQPQRENYKPSMATNILSRIAGLAAVSPMDVYGGQPIGFKSNPEVMNKIINSGLGKPYEDAVQDWGMKLKPLAELADAERGSNTNSRMIASNLLASKDRQDTMQLRRDLAKEQINSREKIKQMEIDQKNKFLEAKFKDAAEKDLEIREDENGVLTVFDPRKATSTPIINEMTGLPIKGNELTAAQKYKLEDIRRKSAEKIAAGRNKTAEDINIRTQQGLNDRHNNPKPATPAKPKYVIGKEYVLGNGAIGLWNGVGFVDTGKKAK